MTRKPKTAQATGDSVWALCVVSSEQQSETLPHQRKWAQDTATTHGWRLSRVIEGVASGRDGPRRLVTELLADLRLLDVDGRPKRVLMIRADRLGRGAIVETQIVLRDLLALGVGVFTRDQGAMRLDSAMDELISAATLAVARHENEVRRDKIVNSINRKRAEGTWRGTVPPYGIARKGSVDSPDPKTADFVREAFRLRLEGRGLTRIGRHLTAITPPRVFLNGKTRVIHWTPTRVSDLLKQKAYVGVLVDESTFVRAQQVGRSLTNEKKYENAKFYYPLSGAVRCHCGRSMNGMACGRPPYKYRYYACRARYNHNDHIRLIRAEGLEEQFVDLLKRLKASPALVERYRRRALAPISPKMIERSLHDLKAKLSEVEQLRDGVWALHARGRVRDEDMQERLDRLASQRVDVEERLNIAREQSALAKAAATRQADVAALIKRAARIFLKANESEKRELARAVAVELGGLTVDEHRNLKPGLKAV
jgi:DNA invertase Pin-like site-specific DNA recombinase